MRSLPLSLRFALTLVAIGFGGVGCLAEPAPEEEAAASEEALSDPQWSRAIGYLSKMSYLPWSYTQDGCYARAIYFTMNLAAEEIPANHVYVIAKPGAGLGATEEWSYHVAPVVSRDSTKGLFVLDPIYASQPLALAEWYARQSKFENDPVKAPILRIAKGTSYGDRSGKDVVSPKTADARDPAFREPATFASAPSFAMRDINSACTVMHSYIELEKKTTPAGKVQKHTDLARETRRLVTALGAKKKLIGEPAELEQACTAFAPAISSCPKDAPGTNPGSRDCCLASAFYCYAGASDRCVPPGGKSGAWTCGSGGNFVR